MQSRLDDGLNLTFLNDLALAARFAHLPVFCQQLIREAKEAIGPNQIVLFGSRARGDAVFGSDFDIAFKGLSRHDGWPSFVLFMAEHALTLHRFDLLVYDELGKALQEKIDQEGIIIYDAGIAAKES